MNRSRMLTTTALVVLALTATSWVSAGRTKKSATRTTGAWTQWGGPTGDFQASSRELAKEWGETGPAKLWTRDLGDGYSAILVEDGKLYTMYRDGDQESVICLKADDGKTLWEHKYDHSPHDGHVTQFGEGPRATPLISGDKIYTIGVAGRMYALNKKTGAVVWSHDLWGEEFGGNLLPHGYSSSPIEHKNTVIALVGGDDASVVAFNKKNGEVAWRTTGLKNSYSTPRIVKVHGQDQLVTFMAQQLVGIEPGSGDILWEYPHENQWEQNISMPWVVDGNQIFLSSPQAGARGLKIKKAGDKLELEEVWSTRKIQFYHNTTVRKGDWIYGSTGTQAPAFMAAVNLRTGEIAWRKRGFAKANVIAADGRLVILDEDGKLALATATPDDFVVHAEAELFDNVSWTVPTIVGKTLFVRDKTRIVALDLG